MKSSKARIFQAAISILAFSPVIFLFQNCGEGFQPANLSSLSVNSSSAILSISLQTGLQPIEKQSSGQFVVGLFQNGQPLLSTNPFVSVQCSLDNATPIDCSSLTYSFSNLSDGTHMFSVSAVASSGQIYSDSFSWTVDTTAPAITITTKPAAVTGNRNNTVDAMISDVNGVTTIECQTAANGAFSPCVLPLSYTNQVDASYMVVLRATDSVGNTTTSSPITWQVDNSSAMLAFVNSPATITNVKGQNIQFTAKNSANVSLPTECRLDSAAFATCTSPFSTPSSLTEGAHSFQVRAKNLNGTLSLPIETKWQLDVTAPLLTLDSNIAGWPATIATSLATLQFIPKIVEAVGINTVTCKIDNGIAQNCLNGMTINNPTNGSHAINITAIDKAGNSTSLNTTFSVDRTAPVITITSSPPALSNSGTNSIAASVTDASGIAKIECQLNQNAFSVCTLPVTLSNQTDGAYEFVIRVTDKLGNVAVSPAIKWTVSLTVNFTCPSWETLDHFLYNGTEAVSANALFIDKLGYYYYTAYVGTNSNYLNWVVRKSADRGKTWSTTDDFRITAGSLNYSVEIDGDSKGNIFVGGVASVTATETRGIIRKTNDQGKTWVNVDNYLCPGGRATKTYIVRVIDNQLFSLGRCEENTLHWMVRRSLDDGNTWATVDYPHAGLTYFSKARSITKAVNGDLLLLGDLGTATGDNWLIRRSTDGGTTWFDDSKYHTANGFTDVAGKLKVTSTGAILVTGWTIDPSGPIRSLIRRSTDNGKTWITTDDYQYESRKTLNQGIAEDSWGRLFALFMTVDEKFGLIRVSYDDGISWQDFSKFPVSQSGADSYGQILINSSNELFVTGSQASKGVVYRLQLSAPSYKCR